MLNSSFCGHFSLFAALFAVSACVGCGDSGPKPPDTYPANGKITKGGVPVPGVLVSIVPVGGAGLPAIGQSDDQGEFILNVSQTIKGAMPGKHMVVLSGGTPALTSADYSKPSKGGPPGAANAPYPAVWTSPNSSPLSVEITEIGPNVVNIELK